jgi:hypothetical protein
MNRHRLNVFENGEARRGGHDHQRSCHWLRLPTSDAILAVTCVGL